MNAPSGPDARGPSTATFDRYHCTRCHVTFREPFPVYYDVTPCPACGDDAANLGLRADVGHVTIY